MPVYGETLHQYLMYTAEDYRRPNGQMYHTYPSLKSRSDQAALWTGMADGTLHTVATDEVCCSLKVKTQGKRIDDTTGGNVGVEPRVSLMYTEMVGRRGYSIEKFVDRISTNAAKIMGLYPRKGALAVGSDADVTIIHPTKTRRVDFKKLQTNCDWSPYQGRALAGFAEHTFCRGRQVVKDYAFVGKNGWGRFLPREGVGRA
jgi:dihydropyrimidinase